MSYPNKESAVIYTRISKKTVSILRYLDEQEQSLRAFVHSKGYELLDVVRDVGSAYMRQGLSFNHEIVPWEDIWIVTRSVDRFSRNKRIGSELAFEMIDERNCGIIAVEDDLILTETSGKEWDRFQDLLEKAESQPANLRSKALRKKNRKELSRRYPYGFLDRYGKVPDEKEQAIRDLIFECKEEKINVKMVQERVQDLYDKYFNEFDDEKANYDINLYNQRDELLSLDDQIHWISDDAFCSLLNRWNIESPIGEKWTPDMIEYAYNSDVQVEKVSVPTRVQPRRACKK